MLNILRVEQARLRLSLWYDDGLAGELKPMPLRAGIYQPQLNELVYLRTKITNLSSECASRRSEHKLITLIFQICHEHSLSTSS